MIDERQSILSEISEIEDLLASVPEDNLIGRMSLEWRLESVLEDLAAMNPVGQISSDEEPLVKSRDLTHKQK